MNPPRIYAAADWYNRIVFGVIALALAVLAGQSACTVEPVASAQFQCGEAPTTPCYVVLAPDDSLIATQNFSNIRALRVSQQ